ncbi:MAG TPA: DUF6134 family protein [Acetobacteraceae bacterium]|nr:DUF6134 family protein [Acetobacteraceae bacterium]
MIGGAAAAAVSLPDAQALPTNRPLAFRIMRFGTRIGTHTVDFKQDGTTTHVIVSARILVRIAYIPVFRYVMHLEETWRAATFDRFHSATNDDGKPCRAQGDRKGSGLIVQGSGLIPYVAPADALPTTYWNKRMLDGPMINGQTGRMLHPVVSRMGMVDLPSAGTPIPARHYRLSGDLKLDLYYDRQDIWAGLGFDAMDGSRVTYERL